MLSHRMVLAPSLYNIAKPDLVEAEIQRFFADNNLSDLPKLHADTPVGRFVDHLEAKKWDDTEVSDAEMVIEFAGRQCYRAWEKGRENAAYIANILEMKHGSVLAHAHFTFQISGISRSLSLELNRHSVGVDISQESQRFVDSGEIGFVPPPALLALWKGDLECASAERWMSVRMAELEDYRIVQRELVAMMTAETDIKKRTLIQKRANEAARASLPECAETRGVWTFNARALRHIINLRGDAAADLEIRRFAAVLAMQCKFMAPNIFYDVEIGEGEFGVPVVHVKHEKP